MPFGNVFYVQLLDASGEVLAADAACWAYRPGGEAMPAKEVDIAKEIKKTIQPKFNNCHILKAFKCHSSIISRCKGNLLSLSRFITTFIHHGLRNYIRFIF